MTGLARLRHPHARALRRADAALDPRQARRRLGRRQPPRAAALPLRAGHAAHVLLPRGGRRRRVGGRAARGPAARAARRPRACGPSRGTAACAGSRRRRRSSCTRATRPSASTRSRASATSGWSATASCSPSRAGPTALFETWLPTRWYLPAEDVRLDVLTPSDTVTRCPYKGTARVLVGARARRRRVVLPGADPGVPADRGAGLLLQRARRPDRGRGAAEAPVHAVVARGAATSALR